MNLKTDKLRKNLFIIAFITGYALVAFLFNFIYPEYFGFVMLAYFVGIIPAAFTKAFAVPFAEYYVQIHKWWFRKSTDSEHKTDTVFKHNPPRLRIVARSTIISTFGIMHLILSVIGLNQDLLSSNTGLVLIILSILPAIFLAPSLNISSWLLTRSGAMYENKSDGTRINMGRDLRRLLEVIIGPIAALNFFRVLYNAYDNIGLVIGFLMFALILSIPSVIVTILLLRKKTLTKMSIELNDRLKRYIS